MSDLVPTKVINDTCFVISSACSASYTTQVEQMLIVVTNKQRFPTREKWSTVIRYFTSC